MTGVIITSHGTLAEGFVHAGKMLLGFDLPQVEAVCLHETDSTDTFLAKLKSAVARLDSGDGVVIFADLLGATPCNLSRLVMNDRVRVVAGANLAAIVEFLSERDDAIELDALLTEAREAMQVLTPASAPVVEDDDDL